MTYILTSIKDELMGYMAPQTNRNEEEAKRNFSIIANDNNSILKQSPKDYSLWKIAEFDETTGEIIPIEPKLLVRAESVVKPKE